MNEEQLDAGLAAWFSYRREMDAANAPVFAEVWTEVRARHERAKRRAFLQRVAAIAVVLVLLGILLLKVRSRSDPTQEVRTESDPLAVPWRTAVLISEWRTPTNFLLTAPEAGFAPLAREAERWNTDPTFRPNRVN
jgi:hypothetical protein